MWTPTAEMCLLPRVPHLTLSPPLSHKFPVTTSLVTCMSCPWVGGMLVDIFSFMFREASSSVWKVNSFPLEVPGSSWSLSSPPLLSPPLHSSHHNTTHTHHSLHYSQLLHKAPPSLSLCESLGPHLSLWPYPTVLRGPPSTEFPPLGCLVSQEVGMPALLLPTQNPTSSQTLEWIKLNSRQGIW